MTSKCTFVTALGLALTAGIMIFSSVNAIDVTVDAKVPPVVDANVGVKVPAVDGLPVVGVPNLPIVSTPTSGSKQEKAGGPPAKSTPHESESTADVGTCTELCDLDLGNPRIIVTPSEETLRTPIDIEDWITVDTIPRNVFIDYDAQDQICNTGNVVIIKTTQSNCSYSTGGVTGNTRYYLYQIAFVWSCDPNVYAATTVREVGVPLKIVFVYVKDGYADIEEAKADADGVLLSSVFVGLQDQPNPEFEKIAQSLRQIREPGRSIAFPRKDILDFIAPNDDWPNLHTCYFAYRGSYVDFEKNNEQTECAIIIIHSKWGVSISKEQLQEFCQIKLTNGQKDNNLEINDAHKREVVKAGPTVAFKGDSLCFCNACDEE